MLKNFFLKTANFFFPLTCSICKNELDALSENRICPQCQKSLIFIKEPICQKCGLSLPTLEYGKHCYMCRKSIREYDFESLRSSYFYKGNLRELVLNFKYSSKIFLARDFGNALFKTFSENDFYFQTDFIIPIPLNIFRYLKRGYNQAYILAKELSLKSKIPLLENTLVRRRITKPQFKLSRIERQKNIAGSFAIKNENLIKSKNILLVDDIATTCHTLSFCARILKQFGAKKVYALTLARD
ncbi:MAG: ComF family protein [Elusimicrobiota bacterium]|jgi:ComF family protein|nr:ComF family protein [Elusimicrobiota bacterium]